MKKFNRRPSRVQVARSLRELSLLWARPPDLDPGNETAPGQTEAADRESRQSAKDTTTGAERKGAP